MVDGAVVKSDTLPAPQKSYTAIQRWMATMPGSHSIIVRAYNSAGAASDPAAITIDVASAVAQATQPLAGGLVPASPMPTGAASPSTAPSLAQATNTPTTVPPVGGIPPTKPTAPPSPTLPLVPLGNTPALFGPTPFSVIPTATTVPPASAAVHCTGSLQVPQTYFADLDAPEVRQNGADFQYRAITEIDTYLEPTNGAMFAVAGAGSGDRSMCTLRLLSTDKIALKDLAVGSWVCYKTNEARPGMFQVSTKFKRFDGVNILDIALTTWTR
jgi:hypothetical protein